MKISGFHDPKTSIFSLGMDIMYLVLSDSSAVGKIYHVLNYHKIYLSYKCIIYIIIPGIIFSPSVFAIMFQNYLDR